MFEGAAALFIVPGLAALGRFIAPAFAVFGRFMLLARGFAAPFGRFAGVPLYPPFGRLVAARLPAFGRFAGLTLAMELPGLWLGVFGRAP